MKKSKDYTQDIAEIRSMMERSSKFLSLSGWAGIMAGIYALAGAGVAYAFFDFNPDRIFYGSDESSFQFWKVTVLAVLILVLALGTAVYFSFKRAGKRGEKLWNPTAKQLLENMMVPLISGGILILIISSKGLIGLIAPFSLIFYGLALFNAGRNTYKEIRILGFIEIFLGLTSAYCVGYSLLFWALGFGVIHIIYGIYMNFKYER